MTACPRGPGRPRPVVNEVALLPHAHRLVELGRWQQALDLLVGGAVDGPEWERQALLAQCHLALNRPRAALQAARAACQEAPEQDWPPRLISVSLSEHGRTRAAVASAQTAMSLAPEDLSALTCVVGAHVDAKDLTSAQLAADVLLRTHPQAAEAHRAAASVARLGRNWALAEHYLRAALQVDPHDEQTKLDLAAVLESSGRHGGAQDVRIAAVRADPQSSASRAALAGGLGSAAVVGGVGAAAKGFAALQAGRALTFITWPRVVAALFGLLLLCWIANARRRYKAGRDLPPGFYAGLRDERRRSDCAFALTAAILLMVVGTVDAFRWADGLTSGAAVVVELVGGLSLAVAVRRTRRRWVSEGAGDRSWLDVTRLVWTVLRPTRQAGAWSPDALHVLGRPPLKQRFGYGMGVWWLTAMFICLAGAFGSMVASASSASTSEPVGRAVAWLLVAAVLVALPLLWEGKPVLIAGGTARRVVVRTGTAVVLPPVRRVTRHLMRLVLAPVVLVEHLLFSRRPHRCLHDLLTGAEVVLIAGAPVPHQTAPA